MIQKILIATLDLSWAQGLKDKLLSQGHHCVLASTGKECQLLLYREQFNFIFLDPDIRHHSGIEVMKFVRHAHPHIKLSLIYPDRERQREYQDLFATLFPKMIGTRFFVKGRSLSEIVTFVSECSPAAEWRLAHQFSGNSDEIRINDKDCTPVSLGSLLGDRPAFFDHYIRLKSNHYVKLLAAGETLDPERMKKYAADGVTHFYILTRIRRQFINYMNEMMRLTLQERSISVKKLLHQGLGLTETIMEEIQTGGLKPGLIEECKSLTKNMSTLIGRNPFLNWELNVSANGKHTHCFLTMIISLIISRNVPWIGERTLEIITLGALLHDLGELKLPLALREKDPATMTAPELLRYQDHAQLGAQLLNQIPDVSPQVIQIILQHHESMSGTGYPQGLPGNRIYPLAKVVALADGLAELIIRKNLTPMDGLRHLLHDREFHAHYDPVLIRALVAGVIEEVPA